LSKASETDELWHPWQYGTFEFKPRKRELKFTGEVYREWASRFTGFMQCQAVCNALNERDRYRTALEKIAEMGMQEAESEAPRAAQEALKDE
jgi:hypothetical protein